MFWYHSSPVSSWPLRVLCGLLLVSLLSATLPANEPNDLQSELAELSTALERSIVHFEMQKRLLSEKAASEEQLQQSLERSEKLIADYGQRINELERLYSESESAQQSLRTSLQQARQRYTALLTSFDDYRAEAERQIRTLERQVARGRIVRNLLVGAVVTAGVAGFVVGMAAAR